MAGTEEQSPYLTIWVGLSTTKLTARGRGVTEPPRRAGYARVRLPALGRTIIFAPATRRWPPIRAFFLSDAPRHGQMLAHGHLRHPSPPIYAWDHVELSDYEIHFGPHHWGRSPVA